MFQTPFKNHIIGSTTGMVILLCVMWDRTKEKKKEQKERRRKRKNSRIQIW